MKSLHGALVAGAITALGAWGCSGANATRVATGTGGQETGTSSASGAAGGGGGSDGGLDDGTFFDVNTDGSGCPVRCSADLHQVLDCNQQVVTTCPGDQGCAAGACVPACQAATANKSTVGCDYYSLIPDTTYSAGACFAAYIANTWSTPITITVERGQSTLDPSTFARIPSGNGQALTYAPLAGGQLMPGEVAILFLNAFGAGHMYAPDCPGGVTPAVTSQDAAAHGTALGEAFHIVTSAPAVAYDIFPFGGGISAITSATLLLPTSAWDVNYLAIDGYPKAQYPGTDSQPSIAIVAAEDNTTVTILPKVDILAGTGVAGATSGMSQSYMLSKGQILQFTQDAELTGSPVQSDKPIGFWGNQTCMDIEVMDYACDSAHQQIPPIKALGNEYVAVRYRNRIDGMEESPPWRLLGAVDGTTLTYDPAAPPGAPTTLSSGELAKFSAPGPFVVRSQDDAHPFYFSGHMTGGGAYQQRGDPEFVNVIPPQQYLARYVFFTDPTYPETNLVFVRKQVNGSFADVTLDCAGTLTGWMPVGGAGTYEYTRVDLVRHDFQKQGNCDNGAHEAHSATPFGLTVWGWGTQETTSFGTTDVSYAYPAGASVQPINTVVVPAMTK